MKIVGLTGGMGSGKTTVAKRLTTAGAFVISADAVARMALSPCSPCMNDIRKIFGEEVFLKYGILDRKKLAALAFEDKDKLCAFNKITHPYIREQMRNMATEFLFYKPRTLVVFDAPLLIESGMNEDVSEVWVVEAPIDLRIQRIEKRTGLDKEAIEKRINSQLSDEERRKYAKHVIENNGSTQELHDKVDALYEEICKEL